MFHAFWRVAGTLLLLFSWWRHVSGKPCRRHTNCQAQHTVRVSCRERALAERTSSGREPLQAHSLAPAGAARPRKRARRTRRQAGPVLVEVLSSSSDTKPSGAALVSHTSWLLPHWPLAEGVARTSLPAMAKHVCSLRRLGLGLCQAALGWGGAFEGDAGAPHCCGRARLRSSEPICALLAAMLEGWTCAR